MTRETAIARLRAAGCIAPEEEANELFAAAADASALDAAVARRESGEPLAWITGTVEFCGRRVHVAPGVYVPRVQSEELARRAAACLPTGGSALDLCCGSGAIAAHMQAEAPSASVMAVDCDRGAVACAVGNGVDAVVADVEAPSLAGASFDVITAVPPYVPTADLRLLPPDVQRHEPRAALDGGTDGLDTARRVVRTAGRLLRAGGSLFIEVGGRQDAALAAELPRSGLTLTGSWRDEEGDLRGIQAAALP